MEAENTLKQEWLFGTANFSQLQENECFNSPNVGTYVKELLKVHDIY